MAEESKNIFQQLSDLASSVKASFEWLRDRVGGLGAGVLIVLAAGAVAFIYVVTHWKDIKRVAVRPAHHQLVQTQTYSESAG